jgi:hypothetical protein
VPAKSAISGLRVGDDARDEGLEPPLEGATLEEDAAAALAAVEADVGAEAGYLPLGAATSVGLAQLENVADLKIDGFRVRPPVG